MLREIHIPPAGEYRTGSTWEPLAFYLEALNESTKLDLLLGYFSSSAISVLSLGFAKFLSNGGSVRLITNHFYSEIDKQAILKGQNTKETSYNFSVEDILQLKSSLDEYGIHFFECLSWLIDVPPKIRTANIVYL